LGGVDFVGTALQGLSGAAVAEPIKVDPIPDVLGDDSSSSEGGNVAGQEDAPAKGSHPAKAPLIQESEDEPEDRPPVA
jgi:hypothetical protein